jgi:hypothetical protein
MRKILLTAIAVLAVAAIMGAGTIARWLVPDTAGPNTFETGELSMAPGGSAYLPQTFSNLKPGDYILQDLTVSNTGTVKGELTGEIVLTSATEQLLGDYVGLQISDPGEPDVRQCTLNTTCGGFSIVDAPIEILPGESKTLFFYTLLAESSDVPMNDAVEYAIAFRLQSAPGEGFNHLSTP